MQKVAKERLSIIAREDHSYKNQPHLAENSLFQLLKQREILQFTKLGKILSKTNNETMFETWMNEESDLVQSCGKSFGERLAAEETLNLIQRNPDLATILQPLCDQFICDIIEKDAGTFMSLGLVDRKSFEKILDQSAELSHELGDQCMNIVKAFDIPDELLSAPIALDWSEFNSRDNCGEVTDEVDITRL